MTVIPAPKLPVRKAFKHPMLFRIGFALAYAVVMAVIAGALGWSLMAVAQPGYIITVKIMTVFSFVVTFVAMYGMDFTQPTQTIEEIWFRKRLNEARGRDRRVAQLNADHDLLSAAAESLYNKVGREEFAKLKDCDIVEHAIEMARIDFHQKKIDETWAVTEH